MNTTEVLALFEANKNDRGIENWEKLGGNAAKLKSFGIGLTQLRKLAKQIGRDRGDGPVEVGRLRREGCRVAHR